MKRASISVMLWTVFMRPGGVMSVLMLRGCNTLIERRLRHVEAEVLSPVRGVEEHASVLRFDDLADDIAIVHL